MYFLVLK